MTTTSKIGVLDRCKLISPVFQEKSMTGPDYYRMKDRFLKIIDVYIKVSRDFLKRLEYVFIFK